MRALLLHVQIGLRLHFRNVMAVTYSYLFPTIFLVAFWTLYRYDEVPLVRHVGELLTITALGGACFGLPTTLVSERERGVWRRYRLTPVPTGALIASTLTTRYLLLVIAALLQLGLAMLLGMPSPRHPFELAIAFSCVAFALMGLGLTIAALADSVPAVQALGQCVFLPMLILGGVAVPLASLPSWAERLSTFFPGRYAVEAIAATVTGAGLTEARFSVMALVAIGAAASVAGTKMFRWNRGERFRAVPGKRWAAVALAAWALVGVTAQTRAAHVPKTAAVTQIPSPAPVPPAEGQATAPVPATPSETSSPASRAAAAPHPTSPSTATADTPTRVAPLASARSSSSGPAPRPQPWSAITEADVDRDITFDRLPPDSGVVTPIAGPDAVPGDDVADALHEIASHLPSWPPGEVVDPLQRVRNLLAIVAVPDVLQQPTERFLAGLVFPHLQRTVPRRELLQILYWIALHPDGGSQPSAEDLELAGIAPAGADPNETRNRAAIYAVKLLGRLMGRLG